jgi:hypothetical protein
MIVCDVRKNYCEMCTTRVPEGASGTMLIGLGHTLGLRTRCCRDRAAMAIPGIWGMFFGREDQLRSSFAVATPRKEARRFPAAGPHRLEGFSPAILFSTITCKIIFRLATMTTSRTGKQERKRRGLLFFLPGGGGGVGTGPWRLLCCQPREAALLLELIFFPWGEIYATF